MPLWCFLRFCFAMARRSSRTPFRKPVMHPPCLQQLVHHAGAGTANDLRKSTRSNGLQTCSCPALRDPNNAKLLTSFFTLLH
mmetsp:Transcript_33491/g.76881  ORF Transcript_33491/g.76881 Transcript_33491/m.76881 type:complete len:82 (+) Transcript_33491:352-597(+)